MRAFEGDTRVTKGVGKANIAKRVNQHNSSLAFLLLNFDEHFFGQKADGNDLKFFPGHNQVCDQSS